MFSHTKINFIMILTFHIRVEKLSHKQILAQEKEDHYSELDNADTDETLLNVDECSTNDEVNKWSSYFRKSDKNNDEKISDNLHMCT